MLGGSSPVDLASIVLALAVASALGFLAWIAVALWMVKRFRLTHEELESISIELPTPGHHIGLTHFPAAGGARFKEPVLVCHGLAVNRFNMDFHQDGRDSDRVSIARALRSAGYDTWLLELRGRGRALTPKGGDWTIDDEVNQDVPTAIQTVLDLTGADRLFWVAHSKGAILQYLFQAGDHPLRSKVAGLVAIGAPGTLRPQSGYLRWFIPLARPILALFHRIPLRALAVPLMPIAPLLHYSGRRFVAAAAANDGPMLRRVIATLPADIASGVAKQFLGWIGSDGVMRSADGAFSYEDHFDRISLPIYFLAGARDWLAPVAAVKHVRERVSSKDVRFDIMSKREGALHDFGHGDLVIGRHAPEEVFPRVIEWLNARATATASKAGDQGVSSVG